MSERLRTALGLGSFPVSGAVAESVERAFGELSVLITCTGPGRQLVLLRVVLGQGWVEPPSSRLSPESQPCHCCSLIRA